MESNSIKSYEPRQIRKKAAINSVLCENVFSIQGPYLSYGSDKIGIYSVISKI